MAGIRVELQLNDGSFTTGMLRAGQSVTQFRKELARVDPNFRKMEEGGGRVVKSVRRADVASRGFLTTLRDLSLIAGGVTLAFRGITGSSNGLIGSITQVNATIERLKFQMLGMSNSAEPLREAAASVDWLRQKALQVPFSLKEMSQSFVKMKATGTDPMAGSLQAVADGIAAFGGTDQQLHRVTLGIVQMAGKGVIQMEEMRQQLGESMPNAMRIMARSMGVSVAELTKAISTGRVETSAAMAAFTAELDRTYGGEAQRMMETFSGQVNQLQANLQLLATGPGLSNFFEEQKSALMELNDFLSTEEAKKFAKELGDALTSVVRGIRVAVRTVYEFREEILQVAQIVAGGIGLRMLAGGAMRLVTAFNFARMSIGALNGSIAASATSMRNGIASMAAMRASGTLLAGTMGGLRVAIAGVGTTLAVAAPWLAALGTALYLAGNQMGWFGDKTNSAWEDLKKFGAESRRQAQEVIGQKEEGLVEQVDKWQRKVDWNFGAQKRHAEEQLAIAQQALDEFRAEAEEILTNAGENSVEEEIRKYQKVLDRKLRAHNEAFRQRQVQIDQELEYELGRTEESGKSQAKVTDEIQEKTLDNRKRRAEAIIATIDEEIEATKALRAEQEGVNQAAADRKIDVLRQRRVAEFKKLQGIDNFGINLVADIESEEAKFKRGVTLLDKLQSNIKGIQAEMVGAGDAYAQLQFEIARGDYGSIEDGGKTTRDLHAALLAATEQKEALNKLMKGDKALDSDLARAERDARERMRAAIEERDGGELLESEKILMRLNAGEYTGLGPIENITKDIEDVASAIRDNAFGSTTVSRIKTVNETLARTAELINGIKTGSLSTDFSSFGQSGSLPGLNLPGAGLSEGSRSTAANILALLAEQGVTGNAAAGIVGNFEAESSLNPTAVGDNGTSFGLAQWHKSRWDELKMFAQMSNADQGDPRLQVQFMMHELEKKFPTLLARMGLAATPAEAASMFMREFEKPNMSAENKYGHEARRRQAATDAAGIAAGTVTSARTGFDSRGIVADRVARTEEAEGRAAATREMELQAIEIENANKRRDMLNKLTAETTGATFETEGMGKNFSAAIKAIQSGKLGSNRDIDAEIYSDILEAAKELDTVEKRVNERRKALRQSDQERKDLEADRADIMRQIADEEARMRDPNYIAQSDALRQLNERMTEYVENVRLAHGSGSAEHNRAIEERNDLLAKQGLLDSTKRRGAIVEETRAIREGLMSQSQLRKLELDRNLARIDREVEAARAAGHQEVEIVRQAEMAKKALRDQYARETNPVIAQMEQWKDYSGTIMSKTTGWMDSMASGLTSVTMGTEGLRKTAKNVIDGILSDVLTSQFKFVMSSMGGGKAGKATSAMFPSKHSGGIVGSGPRRGVRASPMDFAGAPKFHTGGIVGESRLKKNEVPIIAKKKEGVFTEEQMAALAPAGSGLGNVTINAPVTVNASGGTPEQNDDMAKKVSREMEMTMRGVVVDELRRQMRPGNMIQRKR